MNVYFLTKAPKSSTFFVVKSFSKKKIDSVECNEKRLDIYHEVDAPFTRQLQTEFKLKLNLRLFDRDWWRYKITRVALDSQTLRREGR